MKKKLLSNYLHNILCVQEKQIMLIIYFSVKRPNFNKNLFSFSAMLNTSLKLLFLSRIEFLKYNLYIFLLSHHTLYDFLYVRYFVKHIISSGKCCFWNINLKITLLLSQPFAFLTSCCQILPLNHIPSLSKEGLLMHTNLFPGVAHF